MRERKPGWYWAQEHSFDDWMPQYWNGTDFGGMDEECFVEIGPRIPTPDETPPIGTRYRDESGELVAVVAPAEATADIIDELTISKIHPATAKWRSALATLPEPGQVGA